MFVRSLKILDVELAPYVSDWGKIDAVKDVLLATTELFSGSHEITLMGGNDRFSPYKEGSLFYGRTLQNQLMKLEVDGIRLFTGFIRDASQASQSREMKITAEDYFALPSEGLAVLTATAINPGLALQTLLESAGLGSFLDVASFNAAGSPARENGATISLAYTADQKVTTLNALKAICELASISLYIRGGIIYARAFQPYPGGGAGCKQTIDQTNAWNWGDLTQARDNIRNQVTVPYGATAKIVLNDALSQAKIRQIRPFAFETNTGAILSVPDVVSAQYFGSLFLSRCSSLRAVIDVEMGPDFLDTQLGDRFLLTLPNIGMTATACEVIETHREIVKNNISLKLATL